MRKIAIREGYPYGVGVTVDGTRIDRAVAFRLEGDPVNPFMPLKLWVCLDVDDADVDIEVPPSES